MKSTVVDCSVRSDNDSYKEEGKNSLPWCAHTQIALYNNLHKNTTCRVL